MYSYIHKESWTKRFHWSFKNKKKRKKKEKRRRKEKLYKSRRAPRIRVPTTKT